MENYIVYLDENYNFKTKEFLYGEGLMISDFDTYYFVLAVYVDNKRITGVNLYEPNLFMASVINDLTPIDVSIIGIEHFYTPDTELNFYWDQYPDPVRVQVSNFPASSGASSLPLRYLRFYNVPQYRNDTRHQSSGAGFAVNDRVYTSLRIDCVQSASTFRVGNYNLYQNDVAVDSPKLWGAYNSDNDPSFYFESFGVAKPSGSKFWLDDAIITVETTETAFPYGVSIMIISNVMTNEFWCYAVYNNTVTIREKFDLSTFQIVQGGFQISHTVTKIKLTVLKNG